jgi:pimeloyl-ACP methyl ester carboxylesterase
MGSRRVAKPSDDGKLWCRVRHAADPVNPTLLPNAAPKRHLAAAILAVSGLICISLVAFIPLHTSTLVSRPRVLQSYVAAFAAAEGQQRSDDSVAALGGRSIVRVRGHATARSIVLLHGFTNSPHQFDSLADLFYREGDNVYVPRLPHHAERGGRAAALAGLTAEALRDAADRAVDIGRGLGDSVIVIGLSGGGTMAAWIAQNRAYVSRVIIIAPLIAVSHVPRALEVPTVGVAIRFPDITHADPRDDRQPDRELGWSTHGVGQILRLGLAARRESMVAPPSTHDIRILLNANDRTISRSAVLALGRRWLQHGASVEVFELPDSLGLPHDVIDPRQQVRRTDVVYPVVLALVHGETPPARFAMRIPPEAR